MPAVQTDVELHLWDLPEIGGRLAWNTALFDRSTMETFAERFRLVLDELVFDTDTPLSALALLVPGEAGCIERWETGARVNPHPGTVIDRILAHAGTHPGAVALQFRDQAVTYEDLDERTAAGAARLRALGAGPDHLVGLYLDRSPDAVVAALAVLRAGAAYVPLDRRYPAERLAFMVADAGVDVVVIGDEAVDGETPSISVTELLDPSRRRPAVTAPSCPSTTGTSPTSSTRRARRACPRACRSRIGLSNIVMP